MDRRTARPAFDELQFPARTRRTRLVQVPRESLAGESSARLEANRIARLALDFLFRMTPDERNEEAVEECISRSLVQRHSGLFLDGEWLDAAVKDSAEMVHEYVSCLGVEHPTLATNVELVSYFEESDTFISDTIDRIDLLDGDAMGLTAYKFAVEEAGSEPDELDELMVTAWMVLAGEHLARRTARISIVNLRTRESEIGMVQPDDIARATETMRAIRSEDGDEA